METSASVDKKVFRRRSDQFSSRLTSNRGARWLSLQELIVEEKNPNRGLDVMLEKGDRVLWPRFASVGQREHVKAARTRQVRTRYKIKDVTHGRLNGIVLTVERTSGCFSR
jgi:hypothetical protein